jgi:enterobacterial common antigen flippase
MAKASLYGSILGTIITLPLYWWLGTDGIVPGLILTSFGSLIISWLFARNVKVDNLKISFPETFSLGLNMAKLGLFIVVNGFIATASMYYIRAIIMSKLGIDSVGYFQAVMTISTLYINILLNSMLADYFPRLSMVHGDNKTSNKLINEQLEITLLLGTPMLLGMITLSSLIITTLYSSSFTPALAVFQWQIAGLFTILISWPLGVMFLAKNKGLFAVLGETIRQIVFIAFVIFFFNILGFEVLGIGYFIASFVSMMMIIFSVKYLGGFKFSKANMNYILIGFLSGFIVLFCSLYIESLILKYLINLSITLTVSTLYIIKLNTLLNIKGVLLRLFFNKN